LGFICVVQRVLDFEKNKSAGWKAANLNDTGAALLRNRYSISRHGTQFLIQVMMAHKI